MNQFPLLYASYCFLIDSQVGTAFSRKHIWCKNPTQDPNRIFKHVFGNASLASKCFFLFFSRAKKIVFVEYVVIKELVGEIKETRRDTFSLLGIWIGCYPDGIVDLSFGSLFEYFPCLPGQQWGNVSCSEAWKGLLLSPKYDHLRNATILHDRLGEMLLESSLRLLTRKQRKKEEREECLGVKPFFLRPSSRLC